MSSELVSSGLDLIVRTARRRESIAPAVLEVLRAQNAAWGPSAARAAHLDALARGAVVVVTGQQLGLGLGPLYTVHKAASAIALARALGAAGVPAVPVFWLQAEDHDWDEIRTLRWAEGGVVREASLPERPAERARTSIAHERVSDAIAEVLAQLPGTALATVMARHYRAGASMVGAFGGLLTELFEPFGLLTIQPRDAALARLAAPIHRRVVEHAEPLARQLAERAASLEGSGAKVPIPVRADCTLSFFHPEGAEGPRHRLTQTFGLSGAPARFTQGEILRRLEDTPLDFSTSALLRPVLQDHLLPTAAYVGGPSECAYAAQLPPIYALFEREMAPFVRRASFVVTGPEDRADVAALGLASIDELGADESALAQRLGRGPISDELEALASTVRATLERVRSDIAALDPGLGKTTTKTEETIAHALAKLQSRAERAGSTRHPELLARLRRARSALFPGGAPQERVLGLPSVASLGVERVIAAAVDRARPGASEELAL